MGLRDIVVTLLVFGSIPYILKKPYVGVLVWSWLSYMNPHRLAWGFAYSMPFAQIIAIVLFVSILFSKEAIRFPMKPITVIWMLFVIWMGITTVFSYYPEYAIEHYLKIVKIQVITFITIVLITDLERLKQLIWVIVLSIGFYSVKGGIFTLLGGGGSRVFGPRGFIAENNSLAVAVLMTIPLMVYLYKTHGERWIKMSFVVAIILSLFTVVGSQSRGAFLAIGVVFLFFWLKSQRKLISLVGLVVMGISLFVFMPESWHQRMETIKHYEQDTSAMGRLNAWQYAINGANDNFFGLGLESWQPETFAIYAPDPTDIKAAHSIYFSVLADHGWIGLIFFLSIFFMTWRSLAIIIKESKIKDEQKDVEILARMIQIGLVAYLSGGAFLSLAYFDLPWHFVSIMVILSEILKEETKKDVDSYKGKVFVRPFSKN